MKFIDSHCHLQMTAFRKNLKQILENARTAGVQSIINVGFDLRSSEEAVELAQKYQFMYAAVGIHPHDAKTYDNHTLKILEGFLSDSRVVAIGEIGLDYKRNLSPPRIQKSVFTEQLVFAKEKDVPVILHIRDAYSAVFKILEGEKAERILLHCFSGNAIEAKRGVANGYHISFSGNVTYAGRDLIRAVREVPAEIMLLETDAPFLSPIPHRGKRNEPSFIRYTAEEVARIKNISVDEIAKVTTINTKRFFQIEIND